jgi:dTDP-4-dehydrorhamnose reductase
VVGRNGQLASCLLEHAIQRDLTALGRPELDICDPRNIVRSISKVRPRAIINAAAYTSVDKAETETEQAFAINRDGAGHLAAAAARHCVPLIHISTDYVFDGRAGGAYREEDVTDPINVYGRSKLEGEVMVRTAHPNAVILRTSWVYSPYGQNFVKTMLKLASTRDVLRVVNDQRGTPTAGGDLARAILIILDQIEVKGPEGLAGLYHVAGSGETTWHGLAEEIFACWASHGNRTPAVKAVSTTSYPTPAKRPANSCLECKRAERTFGIQMPAWKDSLRTCLAQLWPNRGSQC